MERSVEMKILLATDGSDHSEMAARALLALGPPPDAEVTVLHVVEMPEYWVTPAVPPPYHIEWQHVEQELAAEANETAERAIEQGKRILAGGGISAEALTAEGHPAKEIVHAAGEIGADLVVVGSKGLTGSRLFLLGSVSQKVIKYAPCSVLVTKPTREPGVPKFAKVILATDGSEHATEAARFLSLFHLPQESEVVILHVVHKEPHRIPRSESARLALERIGQARREEAERIVEDTKSRLATSARVITAIREGNPTEEILKASSEAEADLIVMGMKGLSGVKLFLLGSVSQKVCRYSDRSVMLVGPRRTPACGHEE